MNHLAHCLLSFGDEDVLVGNFIGDYIKGSRWQQYPAGIQKGILLHRVIDAFTDQHPMTGRSVERLRPFAGRYAPPVVDILYDHLLSLYWRQYVPPALFPAADGSGGTLEVFCEKTYDMLARRKADMPAPMQERLPRMLSGRFLHTYQSREGMAWVMDWFSRRLPAGFQPTVLLSFFFERLEDFSADFHGFFPDLLDRVNTELALPLVQRPDPVEK